MAFCSPVFDQQGITSQQYNVLPILRGAGLGGFRHWTFAERMIEQAPGITRLLDRLERKKLVRRERPSENADRFFVTSPSLGSISCENSTPPLRIRTIKRCIGWMKPRSKN
jgi:hypothetical protein